MIDGGHDNDVMYGGSGSDFIYGGKGDDYVIHAVDENSGDQDYANGESGEDTLVIAVSFAQFTEIETAGIQADFAATPSSELFNFGDYDLTFDFDLSVENFESLSFIVSLPPTPPPAEISLSDEGVLTLLGIDMNDNSGFSVSGAGDVNGDGFDDLIIGAYQADPNGNESGESYVVFGSGEGFASDIELSSLDGTNGFVLTGIDPLDQSGRSVSGAGDVNGDGIDDIIVGAAGADPDGNSSAGESYVIFGSNAAFAAEIDLSALNGINGFVLKGIDANDYSGTSVSGAGDVNGDGFDDLIIGAFLADPNGNSGAGESYVVFGTDQTSSEIELSALDGTNGFVVSGTNVNERIGGSVSGAGDVNGDGFDDLIIGVQDTSITGAEGVYVLFGSGEGFASEIALDELDGTNGFKVDTGSVRGSSVSTAGDINGDGLDDIIIGASRINSNPRESYVIFGSSDIHDMGEFDLNALDGTNGFVLMGAYIDDRSGFSVSDAGDINGDGFDDVIIGAYNVDSNTVDDTYESYVIFGSGDDFEPEIDLNALDGINGFVIEGKGLYAEDNNFRSVSSAEDVNGDGFDDLIIGAYSADPDFIGNSGETYVIFGGSEYNGTPIIEGDASDNVLNGTAGNNIIIGGQGDDTIHSNGGLDTLKGGAGDDQLSIVDTNFFRIDGGSGYDTLLVDSDLNLNLSTLDNNSVKNIESIDLMGTGSSLSISKLDVLDITDSDGILWVDGNENDQVLLNTSWANQGEITTNGETYTIYQQDNATILVDTDINTFIQF